MQEVSRKANNVVENLNTTTSGLNNKLNNNNTPVGVLLNDEDAAADIRVTLHNLQTSSIKLDENLEALQHNFLLRGFFKKKAKREAGGSEAERTTCDRQLKSTLKSWIVVFGSRPKNKNVTSLCHSLVRLTLYCNALTFVYNSTATDERNARKQFNRSMLNPYVQPKPLILQIIYETAIN